MQKIHATGDPYLQECDVSENLSLKWQPNYQIHIGQAKVRATFMLTLIEKGEKISLKIATYCRQL